jgi:hypothetical protein
MNVIWNNIVVADLKLLSQIFPSTRKFQNGAFRTTISVASQNTSMMSLVTNYTVTKCGEGGHGSKRSMLQEDNS